MFPPLPVPTLVADKVPFERIKQLLDITPSVKKAAIFGSYARHLIGAPIVRDFPIFRDGEWHVWRPESDLDVTIYVGIVPELFANMPRKPENSTELSLQQVDDITKALTDSLPEVGGHKINYQVEPDLFYYLQQIPLTIEEAREYGEDERAMLLEPAVIVKDMPVPGEEDEDLQPLPARIIEFRKTGRSF